MVIRSDRLRRGAIACTVVAAVLLVVSITLPPARSGVASTISLHELFDLLLAGDLPLRIPRWLGIFGYLPALGGGLLLLAEAAQGGLRVVVRSVGLVVAVVSVVAIVVFGPWDAPGNLGTGSWLALAGVGFALAATLIELYEPLRARFGGTPEHRTNGEPHVLSTLRE